MYKVLVVGNGESRKNLDLSKFKHTHTIIGCNAIHRDLTVDHLVCCDKRMADEATRNPNNKDTLIYVRSSWHHYFRKIQKNKNVVCLPDLPFQGESKKDQPDHWGSGGYAILLSALLGFQEVNIVGFDLYSTDGKVNNIYKNTQNYSKTDSQAVDYSYWVYQIARVFKKYPDVSFNVINEKNWEMPVEWNCANVNFIFFDSIDVDNKYLSSIITSVA